MLFFNRFPRLMLWAGVAVVGVSCSRTSEELETTSTVQEQRALPPEPVVTYTPEDAQAGQKIEHGELIVDVDEARKALHAQHHPYGVLETRRLPGVIQSPAMTSIEDFAVSNGRLPVINPGPGEYVHVMEGQRHGYQNLTIGITYTAPGGAPPMHTHMGEEAHVLLEGNILYALGDTTFTMEAPYIVNIPPMTPHSFKNLGDNVAELVVIFPTNVWEYDILDYFPFADQDTTPAGGQAGKE
jgi:quercetin dioxygenase-like cupin family protein